MATKPRQDIEPDQNDFEETPGPRKSATDELIEHYKEEAARRDTIPYCYLYKYEDPKTGQELHQIGQYSGEEIPDPHKIGLKFGSGRYGIKLYTAKGTAASRMQNYSVFKLHAVYDEYKAKADADAHAAELKRLNGGQQLAAIPAAGNIAEPFLMVKEILGMMLPLISAANRPAIQTGPRQETPAEMINSYTMMQKLLKANLFDTAETLKQYQQRYAGAAADGEIEYNEDEPEEREKTVVEKIIEMIEPFFSLIASKSPAASIAAQGLKAAPQFIEILNDPALCRMIVQYFDRTKGRAASDMALKNIGIDRMKLFSQVPAAPGSPAPRTAAQRAAPAAGNGNNGKRTASKPQQAAATTLKT